MIFDENESFDHYFGTYPNAANSDPGEPKFTAMPSTPTPNGLLHDNLLTANPNTANPERLSRSAAVPCGQNHAYGAEQAAFDGGRMDRFVVSGNTHGVNPGNDADNTGTMTGDPNPVDDCGGGTAVMTGQNVGDLMNARGVTWGWFQGGFKPTVAWAGGATKAVCGASHPNKASAQITDYSAHHEPFQYYASTSNPHHLPPSSVAAIGSDDGLVHHQYDLSDFWAAVNNGNMPQVSFLKPAAYQDAHPGNSGPLDEQDFLTSTIDALEKTPEWSSMAIVIAYDDSDGWYDHVDPGVLNPSSAASDARDGAGHCGAGLPDGGYEDRCGPGPRLPLIVVSPWAKPNFIDHTPLEQTSILKFIEANWGLGSIGDHSFDDRASSLDSMFDFNGAGSNPPVQLDTKWGTVAGQPTPTPVPTATPAPTATPTPKPTPTPVPVHKPAVKLRCKESGTGRRYTVRCTATGADAGKATKLRFALMKGSKTVASVTSKLSHKAAKVVFKPKKRIKAGKYTLRITITQGKASITQKVSVRVK